MVGSDGTVSRVEIVSLSPHVEKPKSQEGNKSFVPEQRKSSVFCVFQDSYAYVHFMYPYHGYDIYIYIYIYIYFYATSDS